MKIEDFKIGQRMTAANAVALLALLATAAAGTYSIRALHHIAQHAADFDVRIAQGAAQINIDALEARRFEKDYFINLGDAEKRASYRAKWEGVRGRMHDDLAALARLDLPAEDAQAVKDIGASFGSYESGFAETAAQVESQQLHTTQEANHEFSKYKEAVRQIDTLSEGLRKRAIERVDGIDQVIASGRDQAVLAMALVALAGGAAVFALGWWISRSITRPLRQAVTFAQTVSRGDLTLRIEAQRKDEIGELLQALQTMNDGLARIVERVRTGADSVATAAREIASASVELSTRTEQQASSLEETAASMEELTSTVQTSSGSAGMAHQFAVSASQIADQGGRIVGDVVAKMEGISTSSRKIAEIIGVVDGIAFQTNILALNAAVEAARAGEQGRGFAVVASEVRTLAQRSAQAAREIRAMISESGEKVDSGATLVNEAGALMSNIVSEVTRVTDLIGEVNTASREQSKGLAEIQTAVTMMDAFTQQNAALVEQSSAASTSLSEQARVLAEVVSTFRISAASATPATTAAHAPSARPVPAKAPAPTPASTTKDPAPAAKTPRPPRTATLPATTPAPVRKPAAAGGAGGDWTEF